MSPAPEKVVIIGAGIVGVATALRLQEAGIAVEIVDRGPPGEGTSFGNAGVLAAASVVPVTTPGLLKRTPKMLFSKDGPLHLRWSYLPRMLPWLSQYLGHCKPERVRAIAAGLAPLVGNSLEEHEALAAGTPAAKRIQRRPYVFVYRDRAAFEGDGFGWELRRANGFTWHEAEGDAVFEREPALARHYRFAAFCEDQHGIVTSPGDYVKDLAAHFVAQGGTITQAAVEGFDQADGKVTGIRTATGAIAADTIVVAAGAWSARVLAGLGIKIPLESERGYHVEFVGGTPQPHGALMVADAKFVITPMDGRLRAAGMVEFGGLDAGPSTKPPATMIRRIAEVLPGIEYASHRTWLGHRPATTDSLPVIGPLSRHPNVHLAFGHHHVGLTSGPRTGRLVADTITGRHPNIDLSPYSAARFNA